MVRFYVRILYSYGNVREVIICSVGTNFIDIYVKEDMRDFILLSFRISKIKLCCVRDVRVGVSILKARSRALLS